MPRRIDASPSRRDLERATLTLVLRRGPEILATAARYSATSEDAEDAYQRGLEILLTKAPTTREEELVPWLKTVVKHEAFAIRRQRERTSPVTADGELAAGSTAHGATHEEAERYEKLRLGAEALKRLKPQELRCLVLKAQGFSYKEICAVTGFSYTKVNRCITEGRRAFLDRVAGIEAGVECEQFAPRLSALADGEASAEDLAALRPHLRSCLVCRSRLREFRAVPARVAALVPPAPVAASGDGGPVRSLLESVLGALQHKAATLGERAHAAGELAAGQKVAAVALSTAALAGGGTVALEEVRERPRATPERQGRVAPARQELAPRAPTAETPEAPAPSKEPPAPPAPQDPPAPKPPAPAPTPEEEFDPAAAPLPVPRPARAPAASSDFAPAAAGGGPGPAEFRP